MRFTIGFNHLFIESKALTGPGYYAVEVLEGILRLPAEDRRNIDIKVFAQKGTRHHYSSDVQPLIVELPAQSGRIGRVLWEQINLPRLSRAAKIDLLFSPGFVSPAFGAPILATTIHDMYYRVVPAAVERFQRKYWRVMIPFSSRVCDLILTVSESSGRDIERYLPSARGKVVVTPLASRFDPAGPSSSASPFETPYILMIASLTPNKNVTRVVEALALLRAEGRDIEFVHIGNDLRGELAAAAARYDMEDRIKSLGKVDDATLIARATHALSVVVPSLYEGFGLPAIEAQALGAPLICSDRSALPEVAGDAAMLIDPEDASAIAHAIARLMDEPGLADSLREKGFANVKRFSWDRTAELTLRAFRAHLTRRIAKVL